MKRLFYSITLFLLTMCSQAQALNISDEVLLRKSALLAENEFHYLNSVGAVSMALNNELKTFDIELKNTAITFGTAGVASSFGVIAVILGPLAVAGAVGTSILVGGYILSLGGIAVAGSSVVYFTIGGLMDLMVSYDLDNELKEKAFEISNLINNLSLVQSSDDYIRGRQHPDEQVTNRDILFPAQYQILEDKLVEFRASIDLKYCSKKFSIRGQHKTQCDQGLIISDGLERMFSLSKIRNWMNLTDYIRVYNEANKDKSAQ